MVPALVELALDYYRNPVAYSHVADLSRPLPRGFPDFLQDFGAALTSSRIEQTAAQLSTDVHELEEAARFFVRHVLLDPAGDYYRYLGLFRDATRESIRSHYLLLIRMFHPDRIADATDADLAYSSRLNAAYHVLHDPEERARYDQGLPKAPWRRSRRDPRVFFQPALHLVDTTAPRSLTRLRTALPDGRIWMLVAVSVLLAVGYLLLRPSSQPALRLTGHDLVDASGPLPSFLSGSAGAEDEGTAQPTRASVEPAANTDQGADSAEVAGVDARDVAGDASGVASRAADSETFAAPLGARAVAAPTLPAKPERQAALELRRQPAPPPKVREPVTPSVSVTPKRQEPSAPTVEKQSVPLSKPVVSAKPQVAAVEPAIVGSRLVSQLESAYRRGNADALAALFTKSARTSDGNGRHLIRAQYDRLFGDTSEQRLVITSMQWKTAANALIKGSGRFSVSTKDRSSRAWRRSTGRIDIGLVPAGADYRIATMFYRLD